MTSRSHAYEQALAAHDAAVAATGLAVWIGGEPTFTDRYASAPEWNAGAVGDDKRARAERVVAAIAASRPGAALLRTVGKQYPGEEVPRWSYGVYARRDGGTVWSGPADPLARGGGDDDAAARRFRDALAARIDGRSFDVDGALPYRVVCGDLAMDRDELERPPIAAVAMPDDGPRDTLAERGIYLYAIGVDNGCVRIDLPAIATAERFERWLGVIRQAAGDALLSGLVIGGFPPPVDETIWWATVTPDPGVLEINSAPEPSMAAFYGELRQLYALAGEVGMHPYRLYYNGDLAESGGGSHVTIGGPTAERSPFFVAPQLLGRLLAYANRHPSLSYLFAPDCVGSSSQSPRPDEVARESFEELAVALDVSRRARAPGPVDLWSAFAPFLADRFGNSHRCEINVEKLWNPFLPLRGRLGVVELRAIRMAPTAERAAAVAALFRAVVTYLATTEHAGVDLIDWGAELHDRFALPYFQRQDLEAVLADLRAARLGLGDLLEAELRDTSALLCGTVDLDGATLEVRHAREFWPIIGDGSRNDQTSRLMDASCARVELLLHGEDLSYALVVANHRVPWASEGDIKLRGVRFRRFPPTSGLHPHVPVRDPLILELRHPDPARSRRIAIHQWKPEGGIYEGVPSDTEDAAQRRNERFVVGPCSPTDVPSAPATALTPFTVDTRRF